MHLALSQLPNHEQERLEQIVSIITMAVNVEKLLLFSSTCTSLQGRSCFFSNGICIQQQYSFALLVLTHAGSNASETSMQDIIENRCRKLAAVTAIVFDMAHANLQLQKGNPFFYTVCKEGKLVYDAGRIPFAACTECVDALALHTTAMQALSTLMGTAEAFLQGARFFAQGQSHKMAAFMLHQAAEQALAALIQVCTGYRPATHNIDKLLRYSLSFTNETTLLFPTSCTVHTYTPATGMIMLLPTMK